MPLRVQLQHVGLDDALRILVVSAQRRRDRRFGHAAARFAARVTTERRLSLAEARYVLALAQALPRSPDAIALLLQATAAESRRPRARRSRARPWSAHRPWPA